MAWLPMYLDKEDLVTVIELLNNDPEVAFIIQNGFNKRRKWIAVEKLYNYDLERYCIWHIPSGPLPLLVKLALLNEGEENNQIVTHPFEGWEEKQTGGNKCDPYFGPGHVGIIWLNNRTDNPNKIGLSSFEWIGNYFRIIGSPAHESTEIWWKRLRKKINKMSKKIGRDDNSKPEIFCLENALMKIENALERDINPS